MEFIIGVVLIVGIILLIRLFGAWMLRINDVINLQKEMLTELKKINKSPKEPKP
ncbi:hypothetical protein [Prolixibacter sp. SD074]|jgi:UPF0716 family protein affecting phage T7 exclusion|uniref:hypothetical protein n=1 Tax=Prolixibacter sp. SD074 TaxID=2652391 RepID=UPI00127607BB|nr:hypothetical protein [Prolixibacter sp. SD074]GET28788.1 hypothetical protein SD074_09900 [Prolixibacter sp. SD074]